MTYVDILGHPTWISVGIENDETTLLLHGGIVDSRSLLGSIGPALSERYRVAAFDRRGHGRTADTAEGLHYDTMADETVAVLEYLDLDRPAHLIGHSDGGDVALLVAMRRPDLVQRLVLIGSNFHHTGLLAIGELMTPDVHEMFATMYGECSPDGREHFDEFLAKTYAMWASEPSLTPTDLATVSVPVLVLVADDDAIALSHTCLLYESIPGAQLAVVPGASHLLPIEQPEETVRIIRKFLESSLPPATLMPIRRI
ncbi:MAG: alpha/beta hydrolase [Acidimicrobiales bacterium]